MSAFSRAPIACAVALLASAALAACTPPPPAEAATVAGTDVHGAEWFRQTGCTACHSVTVHNVLNLTAVAPDLTFAVEDVPKRFGVSLDEFLQAPTGTMAMVLSSRIPLTPEQRALAATRLKEAYRIHQEKGGVVRPIASH